MAPLEDKKHAGEGANLDNVGESIDSWSRGDAVATALDSRA